MRGSKQVACGQGGDWRCSEVRGCSETWKVWTRVRNWIRRATGSQWSPLRRGEEWVHLGYAKLCQTERNPYFVWKKYASFVWKGKSIVRWHTVYPYAAIILVLAWRFAASLCELGLKFHNKSPAALPLWAHHREALLFIWIEFSCLWSATVGKTVRLAIY